MKKLSVFILLVIALVCITPTACKAESVVKLDCKSAILISEDGQVLQEHNSDAKRPIASMTKIMTLLLCYESLSQNKIQLDQDVVVSQLASSMGGSQVFLDANCTYKVENLIKSIIICSANDSCVAMAEHICGSVEAFVDKMNSRAKELGCNSTCFQNCTGLPAVNHFSTAKDIATMMLELIKHEHYFKCSNTWMEDFVHPSGRVTGMTNTNKLVRFYQGCDGGKTGYTSEAGHCLCATAKRGDTRFVSVVIGATDSKSRFKQTSEMLNYGFANYQNTCYASVDTQLDSISVTGGKEKLVDVGLADNLSFFGKKSDSSKLSVEYQLSEKLSAPIAVGDKVGVANLLNPNGQIVKSVDIIAKNSVEKMSYWDYIRRIISQR